MFFTPWFLVWFVLSATLLFLLSWTTYILYRQKKAWKLYASKRGMKYRSASMMDDPYLDGMLDDYKVSLFPSEYAAGERRKRGQKVVSVETVLSSDMPFDGALASGDLASFVSDLELKHWLKNDATWPDDSVISTDQRGSMDVYLTPERIAVLADLMKIEASCVILAFRNDVCVLRIDTRGALADPKAIDTMIKALTQAAKVLELTDMDISALKKAGVKDSSKKASVLDVADEDISAGGLELDDDE